MSAKSFFLKLISSIWFALLTQVASAQFRGVRPPSLDERPLLPPISDLSDNSQFGNSIAIDGDTAVVGAHRASGAGPIDAGTALVFTRVAGDWNMTARFTASNPAALDHFGWWVAIRGDLIVITSVGGGAPGLGTGAAYVFRRVDNTWTQEAILRPSDSNPNFGNAVAVESGTILVSASAAYALTSNFRGAAYVFELVDGQWTQTAILQASDGAVGDSFATSLAIEAETAICGAPARGVAYVFKRTASLWLQTAIVAPAPPAAGCGFSVALSGDTMLLGAPGVGLDSGTAKVFTRSAGVWTEQATLDSPTLTAYGSFGWSVALNGNTAVVGAPFENSVVGAAHIFTRSGSLWHTSATLTASDADVHDESYGWAVGIDQATAVVGAIFFGDSIREDPGAAYAYSLGLAGDANCDGSVDAGDQAPFVLALTDPPAFALRNAGCPMSQADLNGDGLVNGLDIALFIGSTAP